jgi:hypothetical protein
MALFTNRKKILNFVCSPYFSAEVQIHEGNWYLRLHLIEPVETNSTHPNYTDHFPPEFCQDASSLFHSPKVE